MTSALTLLEVLVVPDRAGNPQLAERYEALLTHLSPAALDAAIQLLDRRILTGWRRDRRRMDR